MPHRADTDSSTASSTSAPRVSAWGLAALAVTLAALPLVVTGCRSQGRREVVVLAAASLTRALADLEHELERARPDLDLQIEISGSQVACRKVAELGRRADVVLSADHHVIDTICRPDHARFNLHFATNAIVLAHQEHSRFTEEITAESWPEILLRPEVRLASVDRDMAPIGYRTLLVWQLAELQRGAGRSGSAAGLAARLQQKVAPEHLVPHEEELLKLLESRVVDYIFIYRSTAEEHNLKLVPLPEAYNLGSVEQSGVYARVEVEALMGSGRERRRLRGAPVIYGATIPTSAANPEGGEAVLVQLLSAAGQRTLKRTGFSPLSPPRCQEPEQLPPSLRRLVGK